MRVQVLAAPGVELGASRALAEAVDTLGIKSGDAQCLSHEITSTALLAAPQAVEQHQKLLLAIDDDQVVGFLKTGYKHLFYMVNNMNGKMSRAGEFIEMDPLCVLDFYVDELCQRQGVGLQLFQSMLQHENTTPDRLAFDRPSPKLFAFLRKHAGLTEFFPQPNRFVVFDAYFQSRQ